jgi:hypothetical protein
MNVCVCVLCIFPSFLMGNLLVSVRRGKLPKLYHLTLFSKPKPYKVFRPSLICNI